MSIQVPCRNRGKTNAQAITSQHPEGGSFAANDHGRQAYKAGVQTISTHDWIRKVTAVAFRLGEGLCTCVEGRGHLGVSFLKHHLPQPPMPLRGSLTALRLAKWAKLPGQ